MILQQTPYTNMFVIITIISVLLGLYIWWRFRGPEATLGMLVILASTEWMLVSALQLGSVDLSAKLFWNEVKYIGMVTLPPAWLVFAIYYTGHEKWVTPRNAAFLTWMPVITLGLTFTNGAHRLIWTHTVLEAKDSYLVLRHTYGVWFQINMVYTYILIFFGSLLLIQMLIRHRSLFRWQSVAILIGALLPMLWSMLYVVRLNLYQHLEPTPLNLPVTNLAIVFGLLYIKRINIVPVAREVIIDSMSDSVVVLDAQNRIVDMNSSAQSLMGHANVNFIGQPIEKVWPDKSDQITFNHWTEGDKEIVLDHQGEQRTYDLRVSAPTGWHGHLICRVIVIRDITERKKTEEEIRKFKTISDRAGYGSAIANLEGTIIYVNESFAKMHGYTAEELIGENLSIFHRKDQIERVHKLNEQLKKEGSYITEEVWHKRKDDTVFPTLMNGTLIRDEKGNPLFMAATAVDITERKKAEEKIKASLMEKEVLLREIHHRVRNNMQIISSLLNLQSTYIKDKKDVELIKESQNRIRSMALIHEKLYQSENLADIDFNEYITDMVHGLVQLYSTAGDITLTIEVGDIPLGIDAAIPCGLIINELVSNSLDHAFPGNRKGEIKVFFHAVDGTIELIVSDDGIGMPEDIDFRNTASLGLQLVTILAEDQLNGEIQLTRNGGTEFCITFRAK